MPAHSSLLFRQVDKLADEDVEQDAQIVGEEVFLRARRREEEIQDLEDEQLHAQVLRAISCRVSATRRSPWVSCEGLPARFSMKMTFSPNVLLLPRRRMRTINTRFSFFASSPVSPWPTC